MHDSKVIRPARWRTAFAATLALLAAGCGHAPHGVEPVRGFQLERYLGRWYEVARLDHGFEHGLEQASATYTLQGDGTVRVVNRGFDPVKKEWREAVGRARFVGAKDVGMLEVSFFGPFYGGYNVVDVDPGYSIALVVGPTRSYLWILARVPDPPAESVARLKREAQALGFDTGALVYPKH